MIESDLITKFKPLNRLNIFDKIIQYHNLKLNMILSIKLK